MRKSRGTATTNLIGFYLRAPEETTRRSRRRGGGGGLTLLDTHAHTHMNTHSPEAEKKTK